MTIHPTAIVPDGSSVGNGTWIAPYVVVEAGAVIGESCQIGPHVAICAGVHLDANVQVFTGASLGALPQTRPQPLRPGRLTVGNGTVIREYVTLNSGSVPPSPPGDGTTRIGERCLLMAYVHVGHDCHIGNDVILVNGATLGGHVQVEEGATISALVPVHQFVRIGAFSYVAGGYRAVQDVPPYVLAAGEPLRPYGLNVTGLKRKGFSSVQMANLRAIYRLFFRSGLNTSQALARIDELEPSAERDRFIAFVQATERGIVK